MGHWLSVNFVGSCDVYHPRHPRASGYYQCVQSHFEELERLWDERYATDYGFWRPYVMEVIYRYLDCGDLHCGFARVKCTQCGHEFLVGYSCKRRHLCPSCHQKRVVEYGEWLLTHVLKSVPHRQWVLSIPKRLRIYFMYDRKLLAKLSQCGWKAIKTFLKSASFHTSGDFLNFHPHLHAIVSDGCFLTDGSFQTAPEFDAVALDAAFQYEVLKMLKKEGKINAAVIENMLSWHHSGFHVYIGSRIWPDDQNGLENLARYIVRACFSQQRLVYIPVEKSADGVAKVIYTSKDGRVKKAFDALDWLALLVTHIPARYEQTVRYYGFYSNKSRGLRKKTAADEQLSSIIPAEMSSKAFRRNWARLIQKIYEVDPLVCPKCQAVMKIIAFIEQKQVIEKILRHLKMSDIHNHDPPPRNSPYISELTYDDSHCQIPAYDDWL